jgi:hypothetical protein
MSCSGSVSFKAPLAENCRTGLPSFSFVCFADFAVKVGP